LKALSSILILALSVAFLSSCTVSSADSDAGHVTSYNYDPTLCTTLLPTTGAPALLANVGIKKPVRLTFYERRYNRAMLEGVLAASNVETQKYIQAEGVGLNKVPFAGAKSPCLFQHDLTTAPKFFTDEWTKAAAGDHGGGELDGLFLSYTDNSSDREEIMIREEASRWTLVHEMMHVNFHRQRIADGAPSPTELRSLVDENSTKLGNDFAAYQLSHSILDYSRVTNDLSNRAKLLLEALVSGGPLEEIVDESLLLEEWSAGRLRNVPLKAAKNAAWYIGFSQTDSLSSLSSLSKIVTAKRDAIIADPPHAEAGEAAPSADEIRATFQETLNFLATIRQQTADIATSANNQVAGLGPHQTVGLTSGLSARMNESIELKHFADASDTPALIEFRRQDAILLR
jgi:hypothetical protein